MIKHLLIPHRLNKIYGIESYGVAKKLATTLLAETFRIGNISVPIVRVGNDYSAASEEEIQNSIDILTKALNFKGIVTHHAIDWEYFTNGTEELILFKIGNNCYPASESDIETFVRGLKQFINSENCDATILASHHAVTVEYQVFGDKKFTIFKIGDDIFVPVEEDIANFIDLMSKHFPDGNLIVVPYDFSYEEIESVANDLLELENMAVNEVA